MCCFQPPIRDVSATSIFARGTAGGGQVLVYSMTVAAAGDTAMVLPIPVPPGSPDDAVRFIDLSGYPHFFDDLRSGFPARLVSRGAQRNSVTFALKLAVHDVGAFEASFVSTLADFDRLDDRFRLPPQIWDALPGHRDFGFAVFKLKGLSGRAKPLHPMAFVFPRREPGVLFFPTLHVHDGAVHATAMFDHTLYCQTDALGHDDAAWRRTAEPAVAFMRGDSRGVIDPAAHCFRTQLAGELPNRDTLLAVG